MGIVFKSIFFIIFLQIIIINQFLLHLPAVAAKYVFSQGEELNSLYPNSTLVSASGNFTLGFFTINSTNLTYLGISYTDGGFNLAAKVWVANRDAPMKSSASGALMIDESGTLKIIIRGGNNTNNITLFNVSNQAVVGSDNNNTIAVLEDSGNLVLYGDSKRNRILWQSFDHPTDTLLPGMKLGYNLTTGQNWTLTSWFSSEQIPASGDFTLKFEIFRHSPQLVIYRHGKLYWVSGPLVYDPNSEGMFSGLNVIYGLGATLVYDASGMYIANPTRYSSVVDMLRLSSSGQIMISDFGSWTTDVFCYQGDKISDKDLNLFGGCVISESHGCRDEYDYLRLSDYGEYMLTGLIHYDNNSDISLSDCMEICWNDCNCKGCSSSNTNGTGCTTWNGFSETNGIAEDRLMPVGVLLSTKGFSDKTWIQKNWDFVLIFGTIGLLCAYIVYRSAPWWYRMILEAKEKRRRDDYIHQLTGSYSFNYGDVLEKGIKDAPDIKVFSLGAILAATDNFSTKNKLGEGGYGPVYKGKLFDGREIAIKRLSKTSGQGIEEFKSELILISKLQHTNLVRLYGCCIHQEEKMLIYEFMPNKSLDFFLFDEDKKATLDWRMRFNIIEGVAQGLLYLHKYSRMKVIHRDLKVSNVLLDENMNSKIADFGMARSFQQNITEAITNKVAGTYGYMAPEYAIEGTFSIKSDVFSFGVLIFEIVSGVKNSRFHNLVKYAWELWKGETMIVLKDEALGESFDLKQLLRTIHVGLLCVQDNADDRPTMLDVISMLNNEIADLHDPKQPLFITGRQRVEDSSSKNIPVSVNGLSITTMEPR